MNLEVHDLGASITHGGMLVASIPTPADALDLLRSIDEHTDSCFLCGEPVWLDFARVCPADGNGAMCSSCVHVCRECEETAA